MEWEERWHPLREEWVIVAAHRQDRPWSGNTVQHGQDELPAYLPDCYLCPGNLRVSKKVNPLYEQTFVFDNDHPSVSLNAPADLAPPFGIYRNRTAHGISRVVCYSPEHNLTLGELTRGDSESSSRLAGKERWLRVKARDEDATEGWIESRNSIRSLAT
jgi:UDPglucose--hexose-1-phosphate uridylyltransferase